MKPKTPKTPKPAASKSPTPAVVPTKTPSKPAAAPAPKAAAKAPAPAAKAPAKAPSKAPAKPSPKAPAPSKPAKATAPKATTPPKPTPAASGSIRIEVNLGPADAVYLVGTFNDWNESGLPLSHLGEGRWVAVLDLPPGEYEYLLIADGRWLPDPGAPAWVPNPFGGVNSVLRIG